MNIYVEVRFIFLPLTFTLSSSQVAEAVAVEVYLNATTTFYLQN